MVSRVLQMHKMRLMRSHREADIGYDALNEPIARLRAKSQIIWVENERVSCIHNGEVYVCYANGLS